MFHVKHQREEPRLPLGSAGLPREVRQRLLAYNELAAHWAVTASATGYRAPGVHWKGALVPALQAWSVLRPAPGDRIADVGAGAGAIGLCLAILGPDTRVDLIEPRQRPSSFLRLASARLRLANVRVLTSRYQDLAMNPASYDIICARGLSSDTDLPAKLSQLGKASSKILLWRPLTPPGGWPCWPGCHSLAIHMWGNLNSGEDVWTNL